MSLSYYNTKGCEITQRQWAGWSQVPRKCLPPGDRLCNIFRGNAHPPLYNDADMSDRLKSQAG